MTAIQTSAWYATDRQVEFIERLLPERLTGEKLETAREMLANGLSRKKASEWIERLLSLPKIASTGDPAPGSYSVGAFVRDGIPMIQLPSGRTVRAGRYALHRENEGWQNEIMFFNLWIADPPESIRHWSFSFLISDDRVKIRQGQAVAILERIAADPEAALRLYGTELGRCGVCGATLTNDESRELGIGPVCREKWGF